MATVQMTRHARERTKNRVGLRKGLAEKNMEKALAFGLTHAETKAGLHRYIDGLYLTNGFEEVRVYHRHVYIFKGGKLVTILPLPRKFNDLSDKLERAKQEQSAIS